MFLTNRRISEKERKTTGGELRIFFCWQTRAFSNVLQRLINTNFRYAFIESAFIAFVCTVGCRLRSGGCQMDRQNTEVSLA